MTDQEEKPSLGNVMADDALEFVNGPDNPFPPEDARNQIRHNLANLPTTPNSPETTSNQKTNKQNTTGTDVTSQVEAYLRNPNRPGMSDRKAAMLVRNRSLRPPKRNSS
jgi:hypothetical protein